jgi:hypothetical protein
MGIFSLKIVLCLLFATERVYDLEVQVPRHRLELIGSEYILCGPGLKEKA